ncbi:carbonic anhydrase [Leptospira licerasiae]|uniref:carbonic anhydrase n=1 Tax=Leptospira licerasiae TaxID=447106 RepID=UPI001082CD03|nr:carbonic anhydrase [Leptospira licerasiae]TGM94885.1 carbonic anhydrase [Leptospira licerasiae]
MPLSNFTKFMIGTAFVNFSISAEVDPQESLKKLMEGNYRFITGKSIRPNQSKDRVKELTKGQKPFAVIVGCSDSRVPHEIIFDQGIGDLFIVRTAGQVSTYASWGSIEFAVEVLGSRLILILGHTKCGAVAAACNLPDVPGHIVTLINAIKPAADVAKSLPGDLVDNAVKVNVAKQVKQLKELEPVMTRKLRKKEIDIVGAVYDIETGKVEILPDNFLDTINATDKVWK